MFEATFVETFRKFFVGVESTFRGKPARDVIQQEIGRKSHRSETESELSTRSSDSEGKKHPEPNASEPRVIDQSDTGKEKPQEDRTFWFWWIVKTAYKAQRLKLRGAFRWNLFESDGSGEARISIPGPSITGNSILPICCFQCIVAYFLIGKFCHAE